MRLLEIVKNILPSNIFEECLEHSSLSATSVTDNNNNSNLLLNKYVFNNALTKEVYGIYSESLKPILYVEKIAFFLGVQLSF